MGERPLVFQPLRIAGLQLRNRMVGLPIGLSALSTARGADGAHDRPLSTARRGWRRPDHRRDRRRGAASVSAGGLLRLDGDQSIPAFSLLVDAIHDAGAAAALQITDRWHTHFPYQLHEVSLAALQGMVEQYARGAERALRAGFDALNVQGAHGWPLARFLSPLYNDRTDQYREPTRVPAMVVRRIRAAVGPQVPILFRLCLDEGAPEACIRRRCATALRPSWKTRASTCWT